jgi:hypothetical protein
VQGEAELKLKLLVQSHEKEVEGLRKELLLRNASLNEANELLIIQRAESNKKQE